MRRQVVVGLLLLAGLGAVLTTGAAPADEAGALTLTPVSEYATIENTTTGPELQLELDRVNPEAVTQLEAVFTIENTDGDEPAAVWIADHPTGVTLTHDGQPLNESNAPTLAPDETLTVGAKFNTTGRDTIDGAFTVQAAPTTPVDAAPSGGAPTPDLLVRQDGARWLIEMRDPTGVYEVDAPTIETGATTVDTIELEPATRAQLVVQPHSPATVEPPAGEPLGAATVTVTTGTVESATLHWEHTAPLHNESLIAYRQTAAGDWEQLPVTVTDHTTNTTQGVIETPGFSTIVLASVTDDPPEAGVETRLDPPPTTTPDPPSTTAPDSPPELEAVEDGVTDVPEPPTIEAAGPTRWQVLTLTAVVLLVGSGLLALRRWSQT